MDNNELMSKLEIQIFKYKVFKREALLMANILTAIMFYLFFLNKWQNKFVFITLIICTVLLSLSFYKVYANRYNEKIKLRKEVKEHYKNNIKIGSILEEKDKLEGLLSKKLDGLLKKAKIDAELISSLGNSIKNFENAAKDISSTIESRGATKKYKEEMSLAAAQMESLNSLYKAQMESASRQAEINAESVENATRLKEQMESLASNLADLNKVYGGSKKEKLD